MLGACWGGGASASGLLFEVLLTARALISQITRTMGVLTSNGERRGIVLQDRRLGARGYALWGTAGRLRCW